LVIKESLPDEIIDEAFKALPDTIYEMTAKEITTLLKSRRDFLPETARRYYKFLAKGVDVLGTKERELFEIERSKNGDTHVRMFAISKDKGKKKDLLYDRQFKKGETREIRLYGMNGNDVFKLRGRGKKGIKVRIIGGGGKDVVEDSSHVTAWGKKTKIYDLKDGIKFEKTRETADLTSWKPEVNEYDRQYFKYNTHYPLINLGFTPDDRFLSWVGHTVYLARL